MEKIIYSLTLLFSVFLFVKNFKIESWLLNVIVNIIFKLGGLLVMFFSIYQLLLLNGIVTQEFVDYIKSFSK